MTRPSILFCDVDRTLLTHGHVLLPQVADAVRRVLAGGIRIVLATARSPTGVRHIQEALALDGPTICFNGAWVGRLGSPEPDQAQRIPRAEALEVARAAADAGFVPMWYSDHDVQALERHERTARVQAGVTHDPLTLRAGIEAFAGDPLKVMVVAPPETVAAALDTARSACGEALVAMRSGPHLVEIVRRGVNKAYAAATIGQRLGLAPNRCAAVGDSENDLELLRWAGTPLTVDNGIAEARAIAHFVGGHCDDGGLVPVLDWLLEIPAD